MITSHHFYTGNSCRGKRWQRQKPLRWPQVRWSLTLLRFIKITILVTISINYYLSLCTDTPHSWLWKTVIITNINLPWIQMMRRILNNFYKGQTLMAGLLAYGTFLVCSGLGQPQRDPSKSQAPWAWPWVASLNRSGHFCQHKLAQLNIRQVVIMSWQISLCWPLQNQSGKLWSQWLYIWKLLHYTYWKIAWRIFQQSSFSVGSKPKPKLEPVLSVTTTKAIQFQKLFAGPEQRTA